MKFGCWVCFYNHWSSGHFHHFLEILPLDRDTILYLFFSYLATGMEAKIKALGPSTALLIFLKQELQVFVTPFLHSPPFKCVTEWLTVLCARLKLGSNRAGVVAQW